MKKILLTTSIIAAAVFNISALDIENTSGRFGRQIAAIEKAKPSQLVVTGTMDVRDFAQFVNLPSSVKEIDLAGVEITAYAYTSGGYLGKQEFKAGELPAYSLFDLGIETVKLPSKLVSIGEGALASLPATSIALPDGLKDIGAYAFYRSGLESVTLPATVSTIGKYAFAKCVSLKDADLKASAVTTLPEGCLEGDAALTSLFLPSKLTTLGKEALARTGLEKIDLSGVTRVDAYALAEMPKLKEVAFNSKAMLGKGAVYFDKALETASNLGTDIPEAMAAGSTALNLDGPISDAATIGEYAFAGTGSKVIRFGSGLSSVGANAFENASGLSTIDARACGTSIPAVSGDPFEGLDKHSVELLVESTAKNKWSAHNYWKNFNIVTDISTVDELSPYKVDVVVERNGDTLAFKATAPMSGIEIFDASGLKLSSHAPHTDNYTVTPDCTGVVIVKVKVGDVVRIFKFTMG